MDSEVLNRINGIMGQFCRRLTRHDIRKIIPIHGTFKVNIHTLHVLTRSIKYKHDEMVRSYRTLGFRNTLMTDM